MADADASQRVRGSRALHVKQNSRPPFVPASSLRPLLLPAEIPPIGCTYQVAWDHGAARRERKPPAKILSS
jgi:hypothetical protein